MCIRDRSKALERRCRELSAANEGVLQTLATEDGEIRSMLEADTVDLPLLTKKLKRSLDLRRKEAEEHMARLNKLRNELASIDLKEAESVNRKLAELEQVRGALADLTQNHPHYDQQKQTAARLRKVQTLSVLERQMMDAKKRLDETTVLLHDVEGALPKALSLIHIYIHVTVKEAKQYIEDYLRTYSGVANYMKESVEKAKTLGYVEDVYKRQT